MCSERASKRVGDFVPLSAARLYILLSLVEGPQHGYAIMGTVRALTRGTVRLGPGTLYHAISTFVSARLIGETTPSRRNPGEGRRRYYSLLPLGRQVLAEEARRMAAAVAIVEANRLPYTHIMRLPRTKAPT
jgi:DNA-binding PadR family transcriptional regulator